MAPSAASPTNQSGGSDDNHSSDNSNNNNNDDNNNNSGDLGKGSSDSGSGSNPPKDSSPPSPPLKVITRPVTITRISTAVQTATIVLTSSSGSSPSTSSISTTITHSSTSVNSATSSFSTPIPLSSSTGFNSPSNSSAQDGSPIPSTTPLSMKKPLPLVSIVLGCLFFITLCFVIYVLYIRKPGSPSRFANLFRRRHTPAASTIASFEPKEFRDFSRNPNFRRSARSFVVLPEFYLASNQAETSRATYSSSRGKGLLALNAPSYERNSYKSQDSYSQGHRVASSEIQFPELPPSRTISALDEYPFEHDATDIAPISIDGRPPEDRSSRFPQSVQDMTVE